MNSNNIFEHLFNLYQNNMLAHAFLIETNNVDKCISDIKLFIKKISCNNEYLDNCNKCNLCHLIDNNLLPSLRIIESDGKSIKKDDILELQNAFSTIPIFTKNNIYIIKDAEKMNSSAYNKLLKFLEEPEDNILGFLVTSNKDYIAPTIISRCELLKYYYSDTKDNSYDQIANEILYSKDLFNLFNNTDFKEKYDRVSIINIFNQMLIYLLKNNPIEIKKIKIINKYLEELNFNVNIDLVLDSFAFEMGEENGKNI